MLAGLRSGAHERGQDIRNRIGITVHLPRRRGRSFIGQGVSALIVLSQHPAHRLAPQRICDLAPECSRHLIPADDEAESKNHQSEDARQDRQEHSAQSHFG